MPEERLELSRINPTASETATFTNFAIRAYCKDKNSLIKQIQLIPSKANYSLHDPQNRTYRLSWLNKVAYKTEQWGIKTKTPGFDARRLIKVRMKGLEPPRREAPDPKSGAAANYATSAN